MSKILQQQINISGFDGDSIFIQHLAEFRNLDVKLDIEKYSSDNMISRGGEITYQATMFETSFGGVCKYVFDLGMMSAGNYLGYIRTKDDESDYSTVTPVSLTISYRDLSIISNQDISYKDMIEVVYQNLMMYNYKLENDNNCYKVYNTTDLIIPFNKIDKTKLSNKCIQECGVNELYPSHAVIIRVNQETGQETFWIGSRDLQITDIYGKSNNIKISNSKSVFLTIEKGELPEGIYRIFGEAFYNDNKIHTNSIKVRVRKDGVISID